tara:strand:- start:2323 stop:2631 length:309 start_codon:yes stop_codon:yes gene_type:complete
MFKKLFDNLLKYLGYVSIQDHNAAIYSNVKLQRDLSSLAKENKDLSIQIETLNDENQSLWDMLDEIQASNNFGKDQARSMMTELEEALTDEMMRNFKPIAEG